MICPMSLNQSDGRDIKDCYEEKYAWWNEEYRNCAITDIAESLNEIRKSGLDISLLNKTIH